MSGEGDRRLRFGYALQMALRARRVSQRQLAKRLDIDPRRVAAFVQGRGLPDYYEFRKIVETLRVKEELFVDLPEIPPEPYYPIEKYLLGGAVDLQPTPVVTLAAYFKRDPRHTPRV